jgi:hypothetical protein
MRFCLPRTAASNSLSFKIMDRSKIIAVITGAIAILISIAYLLIVQFLDFRGQMVPAPVDLSQLHQPAIVAAFIQLLFRLQL